MREQLKLGDWVQANKDIVDEDGGPVVASKGDVGHVVQDETGECWAMVHFERTGWTTGVPAEEVAVLCDYAGQHRTSGN